MRHPVFLWCALIFFNFAVAGSDSFARFPIDWYIWRWVLFDMYLVGWVVYFLWLLLCRYLCYLSLCLLPSFIYNFHIFGQTNGSLNCVECAGSGCEYARYLRAKPIAAFNRLVSMHNFCSRNISTYHTWLSAENWTVGDKYRTMSFAYVNSKPILIASETQWQVIHIVWR